MTVKDLINKKDYPYIGFRITCPWSENGEFFGACYSKNGKLIPLDGDNYSEDDTVIKYEEYISADGDICLDVLVEGEWY